MNLTQSCRQCSTEYVVTESDLTFVAKFEMPAPTLCPPCRQQRRLAFRNERTLYSRTCDLCQKHMISIYRPGTAYTVFCSECWWSDKWDPLSYGRDFDFSRGFFEQFDELLKAVPQISLQIAHNENAEYVSYSGYNKSCYLIFAAEYNENCLYGSQIIKSQNCVDTLHCFESQRCYEVTDVDSCYNLLFSKDCKNCSDSMFLADCRGCRSCLFSTNLRNKEFNIFNQPHTKEAYEKKKMEIFEQLRAGKLTELLEQFEELQRKSIHRNLEMINVENSVGDHLLSTKNVQQSFDVAHAQDCTYVYTAFNIKDAMDVCHATDVELACEGSSLGYGSYDIACCALSWTTTNGRYFYNVLHSNNIFGCVGLKRNSYCIFNKQYEKEEYEKLRAQIIQHMKNENSWGEFFPMNISPFNYEETNAQIYFPRELSESVQLKNTSKGGEAEEIRTCQECDKQFRIVPQEVEFYASMNLPVPEQCHNCRHQRRMSQRNPRTLREAVCSKCSQPMMTSFSSGKEGLVYCEKCYLAEVY